MRHWSASSAGRFTRYWKSVFKRNGISPEEAEASLSCFLYSVLDKEQVLEVRANPDRANRIIHRHLNQLNDCCQRRARRLIWTPLQCLRRGCDAVPLQVAGSVHPRKMGLSRHVVSNVSASVHPEARN